MRKKKNGRNFCFKSFTTLHPKLRVEYQFPLSHQLPPPPPLTLLLYASFLFLLLRFLFDRCICFGEEKKEKEEKKYPEATEKLPRSFEHDPVCHFCQCAVSPRHVLRAIIVGQRLHLLTRRGWNKWRNNIGSVQMISFGEMMSRQ